MAKPASGQDEFVDLYEVLSVPENSDIEQLRKRINVLYIEAQQNLDHRNVKKRLHFQQLYEIYLPQARHLLLDASRRSEYDRYLKAFRTGGRVEPSSAPSEQSPDTRIADAFGESGGAPGRISNAGLPGAAVEEVDPAQLAAEREAMWAKWKTGLETISDEQPDSTDSLTSAGAPARRTANATETTALAANTPAAVARPARSATAATTSARIRPAPLVPRAAPQPQVAPAPSAPPRSFTPRPVEADTSSTPAPASQLELQREKQRFELIKNAVQNAGLMWGAVAAVSIFLLGCVILFAFDGSLKTYPLGLSRPAFTGLCFLVVILASIGGGYLSQRSAKRRAVAELSVLSLEELLRRAR